MSKMDDHIKATVDAWPPIPADQLDRLAMLLRPPESDRALAAHIKDVVDQAPPLTPEGREELAAILRPREAGIDPIGALAIERMLGGKP